MTAENTDPRPLYRSALSWVQGLIAAVRPDQLADPTPCPDFDVRALLGHLVVTVEKPRVLAEGGDVHAVAQVVTGVADDGWAAAYGAMTDKLWAIWADDALLTRPLTAPWGEVPGAALLMGYLNETLVHGWDLAVATGRTARPTRSSPRRRWPPRRPTSPPRSARSTTCRSTPPSSRRRKPGRPSGWRTGRGTPDRALERNGDPCRCRPRFQQAPARSVANTPFGARVTRCACRLTPRTALGIAPVAQALPAPPDAAATGRRLSARRGGDIRIPTASRTQEGRERRDGAARPSRSSSAIGSEGGRAGGHQAGMSASGASAQIAT